MVAFASRSVAGGRAATLVLLLLLAFVCSAQFDTNWATAEEKKEAALKPPAGEVMELFDGKTLKNWKICDYGGQGDVRVEQGQLIIDPGEPISGVRWSGAELPKSDYEISFDAKRVDGNDFFCALTFPVKDSTCSLILGGWGGSLTGLSNINDFDASENDTTDYYAFENGKWYKVRVRVDEQFIRCWLNDDKIAEIDHTKNRISIRIEMDLSKPLGLATFQTRGAVKNLKLTKLHAATDKKPEKNTAEPSPKKE